MNASRSRRNLLVALLVVAIAIPAAAALAPAMRDALSQSRYVYVASTRKDGSLGRPAEIWFMADGEAVYVSSPTTTWRVRRIRAGRPQARIWIGKPDGPSFDARGEIVRDEAIERRLGETFGRKYADQWKSWEERFRQQHADGSRVLIRYVPVE